MSHKLNSEVRHLSANSLNEGGVNDGMFLATGFAVKSAWGAWMNREGAPVREESGEN